MTGRREFIASATAFCASSPWRALAEGAQETGGVYPGWKPGEMDLHFIYTGCGENMFYRLPDGTAVLNDVGERYRPKDVVEPFKVGALDQIALQRDPSAYKGVFSVRNICSNGCLWDGADGVRDCAAETVAATGCGTLPQNMLSMGFVVRYGRFRFWTGGDLQPGFMKKGFETKEGPYDYEAEVGRRVGPVTLCKMNHHGCGDAMGEGFVGAVRAKIYVSCVWSHWHVRESTMKRLVSRKFHPDFDPIVIPNFMPGNRAREYAGRPFMRNIPAETRNGVHVVVKVMPGGDDWKIYLLDARDESMRVVRTISGRA